MTTPIESPGQGTVKCPVNSPRTETSQAGVAHPFLSVPQRSWRAVRAAWNGLARRRPPLWPEAVVVVWLLWICDAISNLSPLRAAAALGHANSILYVEAPLQ